MALGYGPKPYVPPGPGKIPYRSWMDPRSLLDLSQVRPSMPSWGGPPMLNAGPAVTPMTQVAGMGSWNPGQLPLTKQLPRMGGVDVSSLYQKPGTMAQPLTRTLPKIGPGAGDVSQLLAPRALNAAPTATPLGPVGSTFTPTPAGQLPPTNAVGVTARPSSIPSGVTASSADDLAALYTTKPTYNSIFSRLPATTPIAERARLLQTPGGWKGAAGGAAISMLGGYLANNLIPANWTMRGGTPVREMGNNAATGAGLGFSMAGPVGAVGGAFKGANQAFLNDQVDKAASEGNDVGVLVNMLGGARGPSSDEDRSWWNTPIYDMFDGWGTKNDGGGDGGGQEGAQGGEQEAQRDYSSSSIIDTARAMGIPQSYIMPLTQQYESTVAYMKANPFVDTTVRDPDTGAVNQADTEAKQKMFADAGYKVGEDGMVRVDDAFITQSAWQQAYQALPQIQQEAVQSAEFARRNAALQAEIAGMLPQATANMDPEMRDAVMRSMSMTPQYTAAMEQADAVKSMTAQVLQQRQYAALQAAGLLPTSDSSSSTSDATTQALIDALSNQ